MRPKDDQSAPDATRREFLAGGAAASAVALLAPAGAAGRGAPGVSGAGGRGDAAVLVRLLRVEQIVVFAYERALAGELRTAPAAHTLAVTFLGQEREHVRVLAGELAALGGTVPPGPPAGPAFESELRRLRIARGQVAPHTKRGQLRLLVELESAIARHYRYAIAHLSDHRLLSTAAEIMASEAQHATVLRELLNPGNARRAVPTAFVGGTV